MTQQTRTVRYGTTRFTLESGEDPRALRARYEQAVPPVPTDRVDELVRRRAPWSDMLELISASAPFDFLVYFRGQADQLFPLAGDDAMCTSYLMGNHTIAERMYRYEPSILLYAPLHTVIWAEPDGPARFSVDRPSDQFGSFGRDEITQVGRELDRKLATLLDHLGLPVPAELTD
ncbi:DUF302 domain-containing protein [Streptomyces sp900105755]|uniref:hypothetical protein n=1 Tax=unclassified Streptomyces TaxID=2593676 RepID=UPI0008961F10|nr:hypothetical protein [Streptomyces sp. Ag109_O5-10]SEE38136.1 hypothetical protein SAMN05216533_2134 [Streptomyces sp. Ag109_O5-10]